MVDVLGSPLRLSNVDDQPRFLEDYSDTPTDDQVREYSGSPWLPWWDAMKKIEAPSCVDILEVCIEQKKDQCIELEYIKPLGFVPKMKMPPPRYSQSDRVFTEDDLPPEYNRAADFPAITGNFSQDKALMEGYICPLTGTTFAGMCETCQILHAGCHLRTYLSSRVFRSMSNIAKPIIVNERVLDMCTCGHMSAHQGAFYVNDLHDNYRGNDRRDYLNFDTDHTRPLNYFGQNPARDWGGNSGYRYNGISAYRGRLVSRAPVVPRANLTLNAAVREGLNRGPGTIRPPGNYRQLARGYNGLQNGERDDYADNLIYDFDASNLTVVGTSVFWNSSLNSEQLASARILRDSGHSTVRPDRPRVGDNYPTGPQLPPRRAVTTTFGSPRFDASRRVLRFNGAEDSEQEQHTSVHDESPPPALVGVSPGSESVEIGERGRDSPGSDMSSEGFYYHDEPSENQGSRAPEGASSRPPVFEVVSHPRSFNGDYVIREDNMLY